MAISAFYYMNLARIMFFSQDEDEEAMPLEPAQASVHKLIVFLCVVGVFWIGLYPPNVIDWANSASQYLLQML